MTDQRPVFDFIPRGTPQLMTEQLETIMHRSLESGASIGETFDTIEDHQVRLLATDNSFRSEVRDAYDRAGINLVAATMGGMNPSIPYRDGVIADIGRWQARLDAVSWLEKACGPQDAREIVDRGHVGIVFALQPKGPSIAGCPTPDAEIGDVDVLYNLGVRVVQLTYNRQNLLGSGCTERGDSGLSNFGVSIVNRLNELGIVIDLSHCGRQTTLDTIAVSEAPVAFTHSFSQSLSDHDRGKTDEELTALADADGYMGILAVPFFLRPGETNPSINIFFDQIDHAVSILGINRVGIGTDWGSWTPEMPEPLRDGIKETFHAWGFRPEHGFSIGTGFGPLQHFEDLGAIQDGLRDRGYSQRETAKLLGENFVSLWDRVISASMEPNE